MSEEQQTKTKKSKKWLQIVALSLSIAVVVAGLSYGLYFYFSSRNTEPAQDFSVMTLTGSNFTLSEYQGQVVLLDFMDSRFCPACELLMPELIELSEEFNDSLVMLSIDVNPDNNITHLQTFKDDFGANWSFALDTDNVGEKYSVSLGLPRTYIIDEEGYITFAESGLTVGGSKLRDAIENTIEGTAERVAIISFGVSIGTAFIAGFLSFFSPCAFPLLPGYMAYNLDLMAKADQKEKEREEEEESEGKKKKSTFGQRFWRSYLWGSAAGLGIFLFYMIIGIIVSVLVFALEKGLDSLEHFNEISEWIKLSVGILIIVLGIISLTPLSLNMGKAISAIERMPEKRRERKRKRLEAKGKEMPEKSNREKGAIAQSMPQLIQLFFYGVTYAVASIGCSLPILLGLMLTAFEVGTFGKALLIFLIYSLIMAILMIMITILVGFSKEVLINKLQASTRFVKIFTGILLILAGGFLMGQFLWNWFR
ncbi:MAG: redoxin domain-containing protein [Candidatus Heimdallarchaeota archaeon]